MTTTLEAGARHDIVIEDVRRTVHQLKQPGLHIVQQLVIGDSALFKAQQQRPRIRGSRVSPQVPRISIRDASGDRPRSSVSCTAQPGRHLTSLSERAVTSSSRGNACASTASWLRNSSVDGSIQ